jgi:4a-hydroxytetrahydrobiopterin dehydratase
MTSLIDQHCTGDNSLLSPADVDAYLQEVPDWQLSDDDKMIYKDFQFANFDKTIAFVNALAWIANRENHHPNLEVGYKHCLVRYSTHSAGGLTIYDFICAAKIDALNH